MKANYFFCCGLTCMDELFTTELAKCANKKSILISRGLLKTTLSMFQSRLFLLRDRQLYTRRTFRFKTLPDVFIQLQQ